MFPSCRLVNTVVSTYQPYRLQVILPQKLQTQAQPIRERKKKRKSPTSQLNLQATPQQPRKLEAQTSPSSRLARPDLWWPFQTRNPRCSHCKETSSLPVLVSPDLNRRHWSEKLTSLLRLAFGKATPTSSDLTPPNHRPTIHGLSRTSLPLTDTV